MSKKILPQSNTSLEDAVKLTNRELVVSQVSDPFIISQLVPQTISYRQRSASAHWNNVEKERYALFVSYFRELIKEENQVMRNWDVFKGMSRFVKTRNPQQCRSHHLKLVKQFKGISRFILMVMDRVPRLKEKMQNAEEELSYIQLEYSLYLNEESLGKLYSIKQNKLYDEDEDVEQTANQHLNYKTDKQQLIKTSDAYLQEQNPVNPHHNHFSIFSSRSEFKPFHHFKSKSNRSSLPSFGDQSNQPQRNNFEPKPFQSEQNFNAQTSNINQFQSLQNQNIFSSRENFKVFSDNFNSANNQDKGIQKMKQFLQCHYLFQLWTSKLEKIMRES